MGTKIEQREQLRDQIVRLPPEAKTRPTQFAEGTQRDVRVQSTKGLRIATRCDTVDQFIETFHRYCEDAAIFIPRRCRSVGAVTAFSFDLVDGQSVLSGLGTVVEDFTTASNRFGRPGNLIALQKLGRGSSRVFSTVLAAGKAARANVDLEGTPPPVFARTATAPIALDGRSDDTSPIVAPPPVEPVQPSQPKNHRASTVVGIAANGKMPGAFPIKGPEIVAAPNKPFVPLPARLAPKRTPVAVPVILPLHRTVPASAPSVPGAVAPTVSTKPEAAPIAVTPTVTAPMVSAKAAAAPTVVTPKVTAPMVAARAAAAPVAVTPRVTAPMVSAKAAAAPTTVTPTVTAPMVFANATPAPTAITPRATAPMVAAKAAAAPTTVPSTVTKPMVAAKAAAAPTTVTPTVTAPMVFTNATPAPTAITPRVTAPMVAAKAAAAPTTVTPTVTAPMVFANVTPAPTAITPRVTAPMVAAKAAAAQTAATSAGRSPRTVEERTARDGRSVRRTGTKIGFPTVEPASTAVPEPLAELAFDTVREAMPPSLVHALGNATAVVEVGAHADAESVPELAAFDGAVAAVTWDSPSAAITVNGAQLSDAREAPPFAVQSAPRSAPAVATSEAPRQATVAKVAPVIAPAIEDVRQPARVIAHVAPGIAPAIEDARQAEPVIAQVAPVATLPAVAVTPVIDVPAWTETSPFSASVARESGSTLLGLVPVHASPREPAVLATSTSASAPLHVSTATLATRVQPQLVAPSLLPVAPAGRSRWFAALGAFVVLFAVSTVATVVVLETPPEQIASVEASRDHVSAAAEALRDHVSAPVGETAATTTEPSSSDSVPTATVRSAAADVAPARVEVPAVEAPATLAAPVDVAPAPEIPAAETAPTLAAAVAAEPSVAVVPETVTPSPATTPRITSTTKSIAKKKATPARRPVQRPRPPVQPTCSSLDCL